MLCLQRDARRGSSAEPVFLARSRDPLAHNDKLPVLVHRLSLFDEGGHPLGAVLQREGGMKKIAFDIEPFGQRGLRRNKVSAHSITSSARPSDVLRRSDRVSWQLSA